MPQEPGSGTGYEGWTTSISYKRGNYRAKLRQAGCHEDSINRKRGHSEDPDEGCFSLKKTNRGEVNHLSDHPENYDDDTLEDERCVLVKSGETWNLSVRRWNSFSLRRKEIIEVQPMVAEIQERWPALLIKEQVRKCVEKVAHYLIPQNYAIIFVCFLFISFMRHRLL